MTTTLTRRGFRASAATVVAAIGLFGLVGCSSGDTDAEKEPQTSASEQAEAPETEPAEEAPATDGSKCTTEQVATLNAATGVTVPEEALATAKGSFTPDALIGDLPTACVLSFEGPTGTGAYAVLPGGAATLSAVMANATAAGGTATEAAGTFTGSLDGLTIIGVPFTQLTQETAGFENVEDLIVVVSTGMLG